MLDALAQDPEISKHLDRTALGDLLDLCRYTGLSVSMVERYSRHSTSGRAS